MFEMLDLNSPVVLSKPACGLVALCFLLSLVGNLSKGPTVEGVGSRTSIGRAKARGERAFVLAVELTFSDAETAEQVNTQ